MTGAALQKTAVTRAAREAVLSCFADVGQTVRRPSAANGLVEYEQVYLCFNVQHTQWRIDQTFQVCVNTGVLPKPLFAAQVGPEPMKHPHAFAGLVRTRLIDPIANTDWWRVTDAQDLDRVVTGLQKAAGAYRDTVLPGLMTTQACVEAATAEGLSPWYAEWCQTWRAEHG